MDKREGDRLMKKYGLSWIIYSAAVLIITLGICIYQKNSIILIATAISGIIYVLLAAKANKYAFAFGAINVLIYGIILINEKIYGGAIYNLIYALPMMMYGYIKYIRDENKEALDINSMKPQKRVWLGVALALIIIAVCYALYLLKSNLGIMDSITTVLGFAGIYLLSNRYKEQWIVWIIVNATNAIMWTTLTIQNTDKLPMLIMWTVYLINSVYGMIYWNKLAKQKNI